MPVVLFLFFILLATTALPRVHPLEPSAPQESGQPVSAEEPKKREAAEFSWFGVLAFLFVVVALPLALFILADVVRFGWTWWRGVGLVPALLLGVYFQVQLNIVGSPNVRKDE